MSYETWTGFPFNESRSSDSMVLTIPITLPKPSVYQLTQALQSLCMTILVFRTSINLTISCCNLVTRVGQGLGLLGLGLGVGVRVRTRARHCHLLT